MIDPFEGIDDILRSMEVLDPPPDFPEPVSHPDYKPGVGIERTQAQIPPLGRKKALIVIGLGLLVYGFFQK